MVKIENDKIKIYSKIDKSRLKFPMILLVICILIISLCSLIVQSLMFMTLIFFPLIVLVMTAYLYFKKDDEKPRYSLSKEEFIIYNNNEEVKYNCNNIINFTAVDPKVNSICINYVDENGKKRSKIMSLIGCENIKFVNLANEMLKNNLDISKGNNIAKEEYVVNDTSKVFEELRKNNEKIKCTFLGKSKMFSLNGDSYTLEKTYSYLFFVTEDEKIFKIGLVHVDIDLNELDLNTKYELSYYSKKDILLAKKLDEPIDTEMINNLRNSADYITELTFDRQQIIDEIELSYAMKKNNNIVKVLILISILFIPVSIIIACVIFFVAMFVMQPCMLLISISKYKKNHKMQK